MKMLSTPIYFYILDNFSGYDSGSNNVIFAGRLSKRILRYLKYGTILIRKIYFLKLLDLLMVKIIFLSNITLKKLNF